jgi:ABC-type Co2+ transport system permease subunit
MAFSPHWWADIDVTLKRYTQLLLVLAHGDSGYGAGGRNLFIMASVNPVVSRQTVCLHKKLCADVAWMAE